MKKLFQQFCLAICYFITGSQKDKNKPMMWEEYFVGILAIVIFIVAILYIALK